MPTTNTALYTGTNSMPTIPPTTPPPITPSGANSNPNTNTPPQGTTNPTTTTPPVGTSTTTPPPGSSSGGGQPTHPPATNLYNYYQNQGKPLPPTAEGRFADPAFKAAATAAGYDLNSYKVNMGNAAANQAILSHLNQGGSNSTNTGNTNNNGTTSNTNNTNTTASNPEQDKIDKAQANIDNINTQLDSAFSTFNSTMAQYTNGSVPLNAGEQAQVDGLKQQYGALIDQQKLVNTNASGVANIRGYQTGAAEYDPTFQAKTIGSIVSAGIQKVADLNTKLSAAVADMTDKFKTDDMKAIKDAWDTYNSYSKQKTDALNKTIDQAQAVMDKAQAEADKQQQYQLDVQKFATDTQFKQMDYSEKVKSDEFDRMYKMEDLALKKQTASGTSGMDNIPTVQNAPNGAPDLASQANMLSTLPGGANGAMATGVKGLTDYKVDPSTFPTKGGVRAQMIALAQKYDPTYSENNYKIRSNYLNDLSSSKAGSTGAGLDSANKALAHLSSFAENVEGLHNVSGFNWENTVKNDLNPSQQTNLSSAKTSALAVGEELSKFFKGTGSADVASADAWSKQLTPNATPNNLKGTMQEGIKLMVGQLNALSDHYTSVMGKPPTGVQTFLKPEAMKYLSDFKNKGYKVDVPGVNYTDKDAYYKYGDGSPEKLVEAHNFLVQNGMDGSPENALQWAQQSN